MSHKYEHEFDRDVARWLAGAFPGADIAYQPYLPESGRYPDFVVSLETPPGQPPLVLAIEVESRFSAVLKGVGQALLYAGHFDNGIPIVILPLGHVEQPEYAILQEVAPVTFIELPTSEAEADSQDEDESEDETDGEEGTAAGDTDGGT